MALLSYLDERRQQEAIQPYGRPMTGRAPTREAQPVYVAPEQQGFLNKLGSGLSNLGGGVKDYLSDPANRARLAMAFNTMRLNPDPNIASMAQSTIERGRERSAQNKTIEYLKKIGRPDLASIAQAQPELAMDLLKQAYGMGSASQKSYAPQLDPKTGQYYVTTFDPATGQAKRIDVSGAVGETPEQEAQRTMQEKLTLSDYEKAATIGQEMFARAGNLDSMLYRLNEAYQALERGGKSGVFQQYLPAFDESTAALRAAANSLGIDIINSATFGALSEKELQLALQTGLPMSLGETELKAYIKRKVAAQAKLRDELLKQARTLTSGSMPYSKFVEQYQPKGGTEVFMESGGANKPAYISDEVWQAMSQEDKDLFR